LNNFYIDVNIEMHEAYGIWYTSVLRVQYTKLIMLLPFSCVFLQH